MPSVLDEIYRDTGDSYRVALRDRNAIVRPTSRIPIVVAGGRGAVLTDESGREVLDMTSGWNVVNTGWNHPTVIAAVKKQLSQLPFAPPWCTHEGRVDFAERIVGIIGGEYRALCVTSGTEAVEAALKVARRATGRHVIVGFTEAYHGGTLGALLAGGVPEVQGIDLPSSPNHRHIPIPDNQRKGGRDYAELAQQMIMRKPLPAAVLLEPIFTNPGIIYANDQFYRAVSDACNRVGAILICDEVGTGFARTGRMFGYEHWGINPDIITTAKAMTSGAVPMGAAFIRTELVDAVRGAGFSSTFGWTPLATAAADATLNVIEDEDLIARTRELGSEAIRFLSPLIELNHVLDVRGMGLEIGIEIVDQSGKPVASDVMDLLTRKLLQRGVFAERSSYTSTLLIMPPLVISREQLIEALKIISETVATDEIASAAQSTHPSP